jgi:hypothetical protein
MTFNVEMSKEVGSVLITWTNYLMYSMINFDAIEDPKVRSDYEKALAYTQGLMDSINSTDREATINCLKLIGEQVDNEVKNNVELPEVKVE